MTPVLATSTSSGARSSFAATSRHISSASASPSRPVATFATPAFTTSARGRAARKWSLVTMSGAPLTALVVNIAAAAHGAIEYRMARSSFSSPYVLMPA